MTSRELSTGALHRAAGRLHRWLAVSDGQDLLEYGLAVSLIALIALGAVSALGQTILNVFWQAIAAAAI